MFGRALRCVCVCVCVCECVCVCDEMEFLVCHVHAHGWLHEPDGHTRAGWSHKIRMVTQEQVDACSNPYLAFV